MTDVALRATALACGYRAGEHVVTDCDLTVGEGETLVLVGPNGAGKTTLLGTLCGRLPPLRGTVEIHGRPIQEIGIRERARLVALLMQIQPLDPSTTVEELVRLGRTPYLGTWGHLRPGDREAVLAEPSPATRCGKIEPLRVFPDHPVRAEHRTARPHRGLQSAGIGQGPDRRGHAR